MQSFVVLFIGREPFFMTLFASQSKVVLLKYGQPLIGKRLLLQEEILFCEKGEDMKKKELLP